MNEQIVAAQSGNTTFIGKPCKRRHSGERYVTNGACIECAKIALRKRQEKIRKAIKAGKLANR